MAGRALASPKTAEKESAPSPAISTDPTEDQIRQRAHEIYLQRGCQDGMEIEDWLQAEAELRAAQEEHLQS
jgi:hypothetical protein